MRKVMSLVAVVTVVVGAYAVTASAQEPDEPAPAPTREGILGSALDELVDSGILTEDQADAVRDRVTEKVAELPRHGPRHRSFHGGAHLETAADLLDMEVEDVAARLRAGETLADIAGDLTDELIAALVADAEDRIQTAVDEGRITQAQADEKLDRVTEHVTAMVNGEAPCRGRGGFGRHFGHGFGHPFGNTPDEGAEATTALSA